MPRVSIVLPVYNRATTVARCVASVLEQNESDFELIAVDDASSDNSVSVLRDFADERIRLLQHETNAGPSAARNTGIRAARGEFVALIDSDDEWLPDKLARQIALLQERQGDLCVCEYFIVQGAVTRRQQLPEPASWRDDLHMQCELGNGTTLVVRRTVIDTVGFLDETLRLYEDWDWVLRMLERHALHVLHEPLARIHAGPPRSAELFARSAQLFLAKHASEFLRLGRAHYRQVRASHFRFVAANAFVNRQFLLGSEYLVRSFLAKPLQNPLRLAALPLAPVDAICGTSLIERAAAWQSNRSVRR